MPSKKDKTDYIVGDEAEGGSVIGVIIGSAPNFIVFMTEDEGLRWELDDDNRPDHFADCVARFDKLQSMVINSVPRRKRQKSLKESLGRALFVSVTSRSPEAEVKFDAIGSRVENEIRLQARLHYVVASLVLASFVGCAVYGLKHFEIMGDLFSYGLGASAGAVGAALSVLLRSGSINVPPFSTPFEHSFQGLSRVLLGTLSGLVLSVLINAEIVLGLLKGNLDALSVFCIIAGFSERYLPDILYSIEKTSLNNLDGT